MEQENEKKEDSNPVEASTEARSSANKIQKILRARSKIAKKSPVNDLKSNKVNTGTAALRRIRRRKNKIVQDAKKGSSSVEQENSKKLNSREEDRKEDITNRKDTDKSMDGQKNQEEIGGSNKSQQKQRSEDKSSRNQKSKEKHSEIIKSGLDKSSRNRKNREKYSDAGKSGESGRSLKDQKNKEKRSDVGRSHDKEKKKERLGGLIFMCSKKTKPDCFHYRVMGVSATKKDFVLGIKPGLKLFLYDYDLKLMYGIYKACSSGGMKLEPKAFDGAFPAQVRFSVHIDCLPLPESIFKKAIKENYIEKNKFKFELTQKQVRKLSELFRPASVHSTALRVCSPPMPKVHDREGYAGLRELKRETSGRDSYSNANSRSYNRLSHERDQHFAYGKVGSSHREEGPCNFYLSEKEYRTYGLQGERRNLTSTHYVAPLDPYQRFHEREHQRLLRDPDPVFRDTIPAPRESLPVDPLYLSEREYQTYNVGARHELRSVVSPAAVTNLDSYTRDPFKSHYYGASVDPYLPPPRREEIASGSYLTDGRREEIASGSYLADGRRETYLVGTDPLRRRETDPVDRLYSTYAASALSNYNQQHHYDVAKPESAAAPVSSRYSFAGPSLSYR
ncbi:hypothetical protein Patl1_23442 [Pistacia atlantica]|uniref:Uncharacterized protein n=1 Tax=Pistacia atlantica TaxID=434234 RepID=A0ACC1A0I4_9ROSI|nr:hypothetical protein Patl1_23442 [Pistacia atlantica]